ncbi:hypothetical protein ASPWEDRAFT_114775 [Aspergillus wentii DTO 134E9]|uniref:DUF4048 domain-containing protein n=1 Tax=Aspergillus wentii DTO 134E9 TaxID=1073089 RepID=A0A1L9RD00_ASPWE|nr:uncharacterized protein ASPWEDRAFT_114775 [Aspergillus wentii DTO 134E9]OJJ32795.1 hypothetical protein ASPWEDRAFT_114775 [Aspergillus wentii DTO 134E9]
MEDSPGTGDAGAVPQPQQQHKKPLEPSPPLADREQIRLKRSSLPPRPNGAARHAKRLTLNFPINIPPADLSGITTPGSMTPVTQSSVQQSPALPLGTHIPLEGSDDSNEILTAIASQERKVLELREELQRAETELSTLKKQWASSEKTRKRTEINHHAEPLIPLRSPEQHSSESQHHRERSGGTSIDSPSSVVQSRMSRELERRSSVRAAATAGTKISANGRRVFQGSHTRTLSLLSPVAGSGKPFESGSATEDDRISRPPRSATLPSLERTTSNNLRMAVDASDPTEELMSQWRKTMPPPSREALMRTGKQMASDLREGLWTFLEDIRQATVGEEGINATESRGVTPSGRNRNSSSTSRSRDRLSVGGKSSRSPSSTRGRGAEARKSGKDTKSADIDLSFWTEFGIDPPGQKSPTPRGASNTPSGPNEATDSDHLEVEDNWDDWDTPQPKKTQHTPSSSRSTLESKHDQSPMTQTSSPRTSTSVPLTANSFGDWNTANNEIPDPSVSDGIPWPAITKMAPSNLTKTASNLMAEWERSLSPSLSGPNSPILDKDDKKD